MQAGPFFLEDQAMGTAGEVPDPKWAAMEGSATEGAQRWQMVEAAVAGGEPEGKGRGGRSIRSERAGRQTVIHQHA